MRRSEALAELEIGEHSTPAEIKAAYRDLVKVWHPDRFGDDARLRQRADERLQRINEAYRRLEAGEFAPELPVSNEFVSSEPPRMRTKTPSQREAEVRGGLYLALFLVLGALAGYAAMQHLRAVREASETASPVQGPPSAAAPVITARPLDVPGGAVRRADSPLRVMHLTDAQMERVAMACDSFAPDSQQHVDCVRAQVASLTGTVDLSGLTAEERTSVQHVCSRAASYGQCAAAQIASLSALPVRPALSGLSARDRNAVERACSSARDYDGPAAYDRCVVEFEKALATQ